METLMTLLRRVLSLIVLFCLAAGPVAAQRINHGVVHRRSSQAIVTNVSSFNVMFDPTPVKSVNLPFRVTNYRKGLINGGCGGTPVKLPVTLQAGEVLLQDFEFSPTSPGTFSDALVQDLTPTNSPTTRFSWVLLGSTGSLTPIIDSFAATPPTIRAGQPITLSWVCEGATFCSIDGGVGAV